MDQISVQNMKSFSESLKPRSQDILKPSTHKPRNQETNNQETQNQETKHREIKNQETANQATKKLFHFQVRESSAPLNISTPTPAPWPLRPEQRRALNISDA